jgi:N-acetylmuramoyl-L-alanine amidase
MGIFKYLIIHCTATPEGRSVTPETVRNWHTKPKPVGRGWKVVGYSDLILLDGSRHQFVRHNGDKWIDENEITNGVAGINSNSRHLCYVGGLSSDKRKAKDTLTDLQNAMLSSIIAEVLTYAPDVLIAGHNQFSQKDCPSFYVPDYLRERCLIKVPEKNIYKANPYKYDPSLS